LWLTYRKITLTIPGLYIAALKTYVVEMSHAVSLLKSLLLQETNATAKAILEESQSLIRTGVYHAGLSIDVRNRLHDKWRRGEVQVVCATNGS
jgi:ATP-dependent DNA helicase Q1